jgi:hypothetical protein
MGTSGKLNEHRSPQDDRHTTQNLAQVRPVIVPDATLVGPETTGRQPVGGQADRRGRSRSEGRTSAASISPAVMRMTARRLRLPPLGKVWRSVACRWQTVPDMEAWYRRKDAVCSANPGTASARSGTPRKPPFISFALLPAFGHVYPVMPLAEAARAAGARVQVAVGHPFDGNLPLLTLLGTDVDPTVTSVSDLTRERFPAVADDMRTRWVPAYFGVAHALPAVAALRRAWRADRPDLVVYDPANPGAAVVADELGIPAMLFSVFHYFPPMLDLPAVTRRALEHPDVDPGNRCPRLQSPALHRPRAGRPPGRPDRGPSRRHSHPHGPLGRPAHRACRATPPPAGKAAGLRDLRDGRVHGGTPSRGHPGSCPER